MYALMECYLHRTNEHLKHQNWLRSEARIYMYVMANKIDCVRVCRCGLPSRSIYTMASQLEEKWRNASRQTAIKTKEDANEKKEKKRK